MPKPKRRIMKEFSIFEISAVDEPAQAPATMAIMKSKQGVPPDEPAPGQHKEATMPKTAEELQAELTKTAKDKDTAEAELAKAKAKAEKAEKMAELTDVQKSHYNGLSDDAKDAFLKASPEQRQVEVDAELTKRAAADPEVYKALDGTVYKKSDDSRLVEMAKRDDAREKEMRKMREDAADAAFEKTASVDFAKFKGETSAKAALAKAIAGIKDEEIRKSVKEMLKAAHSAVGLTLKEVGTGADDYDADDEAAEANNKAQAEKKLDGLAKKYATDNKVDYSKAYTAVLETDEGQSLYGKTLA